MVIVSGRVEKEALFEAIQPVEKEEEAKERETFEKPFQTPCPDLPPAFTVEKVVEYPDGKSRGIVNLVGSWASIKTEIRWEIWYLQIRMV